MRFLGQVPDIGMTFREFILHVADFAQDEVALVGFDGLDISKLLNYPQSHSL